MPGSPCRCPGTVAPGRNLGKEVMTPYARRHLVDTERRERVEAAAPVDVQAVRWYAQLRVATLHECAGLRVLPLREPGILDFR